MKPTRRLRHSLFFLLTILAFELAFIPLASTNSAIALPEKKILARPARWEEGSPGCTFSRSADGRYYYAISSDDIVVTLAVDSQELEKVRRRHELFFSVALTLRNRGAAELDVKPGNISLQFLKHFKVVQTALDPDAFSQKVQADADEFDHQMAREVLKHPEEKEAKQTSVRTFQKETAELQEFLGNKTLKPSRLNPGNPEVTGWVLFSTDSTWLGTWKRQEEFILRVPLGSMVFEFPFKLPPKEGELLLRQRQ